jgi:hypothetical protein
MGAENRNFVHFWLKISMIFGKIGGFLANLGADEQ